MDRLAGEISSEPCNDFERVCRLEDPEPAFSVSLIERSRSDSDSDDIPDEDEFDESPLVPLTDPRLPNALLPLFWSPKTLSVPVEGMPTGWEVDARLALMDKEAPNLRS